MIRVIDNKKIDLTEDEWNLYQKIVKDYTTVTNRGEDQFMDLFETDASGIITFLRPPSKRMISMEVFLFICSIFQHQHLRLLFKQNDIFVAQMKDKFVEMEKKFEGRFAVLEAKLK